MKKIVLFLLLTTLILADSKHDLYTLYQQKDYKKACSVGLIDFSKNMDDETFVSIYAFSCLNADYIDRLGVPLSVLKKTKEARENAAYLSIILMQKKLLERALMDEYSLKDLKLPTTDTILSKVFDLFSKQQPDKLSSLYVLVDPHNAKISYKLYLQDDDDGTKNIVVEEWYDSALVKTHVYK